MVLVTEGEATRFASDCMSAAGCDADVSAAVARLLVGADLKGHKSHGLNRINIYLREINCGVCYPRAAPEVVRESESTAWVDGNSALGVVVGEFCMELAMKKAAATGVGWVAAKRSNHFGIAGHYSEMALEKGMIGMAFCNTPALMVPTGARQPALGSNPIAFAAPGAGGDYVSLDMATTCKAAGKVELYRRTGEPIPSGWAVDAEGKPTTDAELAVAGQPKLTPLGGPGEDGSGYKGFGLGLMVDALTGVLSGSRYAHTVRKWAPSTALTALTEENDLGQCFVALDPRRFAPGFEIRMQDTLDHLRGLEPAPGEAPVRVPGDPERESVRRAKGHGRAERVIDYPEKVLVAAGETAARMKVKPMQKLAV